MSGEGNGEGLSPMQPDEKAIAADVDNAITESWNKSRVSRIRRRLAVAAAAGIAAVSFGMLASSGGGGHPDTGHETGTSQHQENKNTSPTRAASAEQFLKEQGVPDPNLLVVNPETARHLAVNAITQAKNTLFANVEGGKVGKRLDQLLEEAQSDSGKLLTHDVYSLVNKEEIATTIGMGKGNVFEPGQPSITVYSDFGDNKLIITGYLGSDGRLIPDSQYHDTNKTFPTYDEKKGTDNPPNNINVTLSGFLPDTTNLSYGGVDNFTEEDGTVVPIVTWSDSSTQHTAQLGTDGSLSYSFPSTVAPISYESAIQMNTGDQEAASVAFGLLSSANYPSEVTIDGITGLDPTQTQGIKDALKGSKADKYLPYGIVVGPVQPLVEKVFAGLDGSPQAPAQAPTGV